MGIEPIQHQHAFLINSIDYRSGAEPRVIWVRIIYITHRNALQCNALRKRGRTVMAHAAERMKAMRERRRAQGLRELRMFIPDARSPAVRRRVAREVARLNRAAETDALRWIEAVSEFDSQ